MLVASRAAERPGRKVAQPYPPLRWRRGACTWRKKPLAAAARKQDGCAYVAARDGVRSVGGSPCRCRRCLSAKALLTTPVTPFGRRFATLREARPMSAYPI